ncbi:MAG: glycosyltransferase family 2 protein [Acidobacteriota bacterium]
MTIRPQTTPASTRRVLIAVPAYNEEHNVGEVISRVRASVPEFDLLVVNDGSKDNTSQILTQLNVLTATHICNLGYGRAIQTAVKYAIRHDYDALITIDADGQHYPEEIRGLFEEFVDGRWDMLIGSRYISKRSYSGVPMGRRIGMKLFSIVTKSTTGKRVYDTTSGLKVIGRNVFEPLSYWYFVDFHAEAIVYLLRLGYQVGEYPITVAKRMKGTSMYNALSHFKYPLKTLLMALLGIVQASLTRRGNRK